MQTIKYCNHCGLMNSFYDGVRGRCMECCKAEAKKRYHLNRRAQQARVLAHDLIHRPNKVSKQQLFDFTTKQTDENKHNRTA